LLSGPLNSSNTVGNPLHEAGFLHVQAYSFSSFFCLTKVVCWHSDVYVTLRIADIYCRLISMHWREYFVVLLYTIRIVCNRVHGVLAKFVKLLEFSRNKRPESFGKRLHRHALPMVRGEISFRQVLWVCTSLPPQTGSLAVYPFLHNTFLPNSQILCFTMFIIEQNTPQNCRFQLEDMDPHLMPGTLGPRVHDCKSSRYALVQCRHLEPRHRRQ